jgi:hypothetical protein
MTLEDATMTNAEQAKSYFDAICAQRITGSDKQVAWAKKITKSMYLGMLKSVLSNAPNADYHLNSLRMSAELSGVEWSAKSIITSHLESRFRISRAA